jgi:hypothetical protein
MRGSVCFWVKKRIRVTQRFAETALKEKREQAPALQKKNGRRDESAGKGEDEEVAFAGGTDGEEAAVGGDGKVAEG